MLGGMTGELYGEGAFSHNPVRTIAEHIKSGNMKEILNMLTHGREGLLPAPTGEMGFEEYQFAANFLNHICGPSMEVAEIGPGTRGMVLAEHLAKVGVNPLSYYLIDLTLKDSDRFATSYVTDKRVEGCSSLTPLGDGKFFYPHGVEMFTQESSIELKQFDVIFNVSMDPDFFRVSMSKTPMPTRTDSAGGIRYDGSSFLWGKAAYLINRSKDDKMRYNSEGNTLEKLLKENGIFAAFYRSNNEDHEFGALDKQFDTVRGELTLPDNRTLKFMLATPKKR